jgi:ABC-2 type transport system ATP-binding protein
VIDHGRAIARGTALQLKQQVGGERLEVTISDAPYLDAARRVLEALGEGPPPTSTRRHATPAWPSAHTMGS